MIVSLFLTGYIADIRIYISVTIPAYNIQAIIEKFNVPPQSYVLGDDMMDIRLNNRMRDKKHIFLTGEIQSGKSTIINKVLDDSGLCYGGFRTYFGIDRASPDRNLYIGDAALPPDFRDENIAARFVDGRPKPIIEVFNIRGASLIKSAGEAAQLIVMDECGNIEREAMVFQKEILNTLDGDKPVLGVLKLTASGWAEKIREHPKVLLISVNKKNRDSLPENICRMLHESFGLIHENS